MIFTRSVDLLGRPSFATASFDSPLSVEYFEIFLGNTKVARDTTTIEKKDLRFLRDGLNDIDVVVKLKKTPDACHPPGVEPARRGIYFRLEGTFQADLRVGKPPKMDVYIEAGGRTAQPVGVGVTNLGPAIIPEGTVEIRAGGPGFCVEFRPDNSCVHSMFELHMLPALSKGDMTCTEVTHLLIWTCAFKDLAPGEKVLVMAGLVFRPDPAAPEWVEEDAYMQWGGRIAVGGPGDPGSLNNDSGFRLVFCRYGAAEDACEPKPAP